MRILGVNGIRNWSWSKDSFTDKFLDVLSKDFETIDVKYPILTALSAWLPGALDRRANAMIDLSRPGDCVVAHSAGALVTIHAMRMGAEYDTVFFFGAACASNIGFPMYGCKRIYNVHSPDDMALMAGSLWPWHEFGPLGLVGYTGRDPRVVNVLAPGLGHTDYAKPKNLCHWAAFIKENLSAGTD